MGWARFDDGYTDHPKVIAAGPMAELLNMRAIIYAAKHETDGAIAASAIRSLGLGIPAAKKQVARLVQVGLWDEIPGGWCVHDYLEFNPSRAERESQREASRTRQEVYRTRGLADAVKTRDGDHCRYCGRDVNWKDRRGTTGAVFEHVVPVTQGGATTLENLVVACRGCNMKKAGRTPEEAGMPLREPGVYLGSEPRYTGSGRESLSLSETIRACNWCNDDGFAVDDFGVPVVPVVRCGHGLPSPLRIVEPGEVG